MRVTVIVPSYNHARWLRGCVDSVLSQDHEDLELIVVDDGSTDGSLEILASYGDRLRLIRQSGGRQARARNLALAVSSGELVAFIDSDDRWLPGRIRSAVDAFARNPDAAVVWGDYRTIDADGRGLAEARWRDPGGDFARTLIAGNPICNGTATARRAALEAIGGFDERVPRVCDGAAWYQIAARGLRFVHVDRLLLDYRVHLGNDSARFAPMTRDRDTALLAAARAYVAQGRVAREDAAWLRRALARQFAFGAAAWVERELGGEGWRAPLYDVLGSNAALRGLGWLKAVKASWKGAA